MTKLNESVLEEACLRTYKKHEVTPDRTLLRSLVCKVADKKSRMKFHDALRFSLNELYLHDNRQENKVRTIYRHAVTSYFGQIAALAKRARAAKGTPTPHRAVAEAPAYVEEGDQLAFNI